MPANPNILEDTKGKQTGPKTEIGKLKCSLNQETHGGWRDQHGDGTITKMMKEAGVDFSVPDKAKKERNLFEIWLKSKSVYELTEIQRLDKLIQLVDMDMTVRVMEKITMGVALDDDDIKLIRLLKDSL